MILYAALYGETRSTSLKESLVSVSPPSRYSILRYFQNESYYLGGGLPFIGGGFGIAVGLRDWR